jgi:hypothetical protein
MKTIVLHDARDRKRPCAICYPWFRLNPRVGERQRACYQAARRQKTQANWRTGIPATSSQKTSSSHPHTRTQLPDQATGVSPNSTCVGTYLRVREPHRQRQLLASLAESGQQTPVVVVMSKDNAGCYLVIDGAKCPSQCTR